MPAPATAPAKADLPPARTPDLDLALIGNGSFAALIDRHARICWSCLPRMDGDPVFCSLVDGERPEHGFWDVEIMNRVESRQRYLHNSAILETTLTDVNGCAVDVIDFAPRYRHYGRYFRPTTIVRMLRPRAGTPRVRIRIRPRFQYGALEPQVTRGSNHIRWVSPDMVLRLTTDAPVSYVQDETVFVLEEPVTLILGPDESLTGPVPEVGRKFLEATEEYWRDFSRYLALPFEWQEPVIRSAITLKMCTFEETGAVVAAVTTSIPEAPDSERNWDYRYCWLRDAYFVIHALNRLGATRTMEDYIRYIINIVANADDHLLQPVYGIALEARLDETVAGSLAGYRGMKPVRIGNAAYTQMQNDSFGAVIMAATQAFFDRRLLRPGGRDLFARLERLGEHAVAIWDKPDAGLWELRTAAKVHTYSAVTCWAACDRLAKIARQLGLADRETYWAGHAGTIRGEILEKAWDESQNSFVDSFGGADIDASLLLMHELGFIDARDPRFIGTVAAVERHLKKGEYLYRYVAPDDFGEPEVAFTICTFWYIDALAAIGRLDEARVLFDRMLESRNHLGLLSEDIDPRTGALWGNFPQTYSMVGLINSAMKLSKSWEEAF